jgi:hypothetical protein
MWVTPRTDHAAFSACERSAHDDTVPVRRISLPETLTWTRAASYSALRVMAAVDLGLDGVGQHGDHTFQRGGGLTGDVGVVGVRPRVVDGDLVGHGVDSSDTQGGLDGGLFLGVGVDLA